MVAASAMVMLSSGRKRPSPTPEIRGMEVLFSPSPSVTEMLAARLM